MALLFDNTETQYGINTAVPASAILYGDFSVYGYLRWLTGSLSGTPYICALGDIGFGNGNVTVQLRASDNKLTIAVHGTGFNTDKVVAADTWTPFLAIRESGTLRAYFADGVDAQTLDASALPVFTDGFNVRSSGAGSIEIAEVGGCNYALDATARANWFAGLSAIFFPSTGRYGPFSMLTADDPSVNSGSGGDMDLTGSPTLVTHPDITYSIDPPEYEYADTPYTIQQGTTVTISPTKLGGSDAELWEVTSGTLPAFAVLDTATGDVVVTPHTGDSGTYNVEITPSVGESIGDPIPLSVIASNPAAPTLSFAGSPATAIVGEFFDDLVPTLTGFEAVVTSTALPPGVTLNRETGKPTGTPTNYWRSRAVRVTARNDGGSVSATVTLESVFQFLVRGTNADGSDSTLETIYQAASSGGQTQSSIPRSAIRNSAIRRSAIRLSTMVRG